MRSDKKFEHSAVETHISAGSTIGKLRENPVIGRYRKNLHRGSVDKDILLSSTIEFLQLAIRNEVGQNSRIVAWDNQHIFGPAPEARSAAENSNLEAE